MEEDAGKWRVAHLRSRCEKQFAFFLVEKGISYYLPLFEKKTRRKDNNKPRKSICPLFPGYLAIAPESGAVQPLMANPDLVGIIPVADQGRFIRELTQIKSILDKRMAFQTHAGIAPGTHVRVKEGALAGIEGVVIRNEKSLRLIVGIELFAQSISVEISETEVVPL